MPRPAPVYDIALVMRPEHDSGYEHFLDAERHPFQAAVRTVSRVNAWWLSEAALVSYWTPDAAVPILARAGLTADFLQGANTDCYLAWNADAMIVAFRGIQSRDWPDILTGARMAQVPWVTGDPARGRVHDGFKAAIEDIWPRLHGALGRLAGSRAVWFCGHSLGGALAVLAADRYGRAQGVCTFGSPRVGDPAFAAAFTSSFVSRCARYVNNHDVVTHVPPPHFGQWVYKHVEPLRFIDAAGHVTGRGPAPPDPVADLVGRPDSLLDTMAALDRRTIRPAPTFVLDHMPKAYAIWAWNDYEAHG